MFDASACQTRTFKVCYGFGALILAAMLFCLLNASWGRCNVDISDARWERFKATSDPRISTVPRSSFFSASTRFDGDIRPFKDRRMPFVRQWFSDVQDVGSYSSRARIPLYIAPLAAVSVILFMSSLVSAVAVPCLGYGRQALFISFGFGFALFILSLLVNLVV